MARLPKTLPELRDEQALATDPFARRRPFCVGG